MSLKTLCRMPLPRRILGLGFICAFLLCAGCASAITRDVYARNEFPRFYPATRTNLKLAYDMTRDPSDFTVSPVMYVSVWIFNLIDLPISAVFDTVMLPWDVFAHPLIRFDETETGETILTLHASRMPGAFLMEVPHEKVFERISVFQNGDPVVVFPLMLEVKNDEWLLMEMIWSRPRPGVEERETALVATARRPDQNEVSIAYQKRGRLHGYVSQFQVDGIRMELSIRSPNPEFLEVNLPSMIRMVETFRVDAP